MVFLVFVSFLSEAASNKNLELSLDDLYQKAQSFYFKKDYAQSIPLLRQYLQKVPPGKQRESEFFWVVDQLGTYFLRIKKDPAAAIQFFKKYVNDSRLNDAQQDSLSEWITAAQEWKTTLNATPKKGMRPNSLYENGRKFFLKAEAASKKVVDDSSGSASYSISASYLGPFIMENDGHPSVGEALFMMGKIRSRLWTDTSYWSKNFYLKEVIRRFPNTPLSWKAWKTLEEDVYQGYSGSSGVNVPPSMVRMLERYRKSAEPKKS